MTIIELIQLLLRHRLWVFVFPVLSAAGIFHLTRNAPKSYSSQITVYTGLASGYNMENGYDNKVDIHEVHSKFDNLINLIASRETQKEVAARLLACLLHHPDQLQGLIQHTHGEHLGCLADPGFAATFRKETEAETRAALAAALAEGSHQGLYRLVLGSDPNVFNVNVLDDIKAVRIGFSDMLKMDYTAPDPFVCKKTLDLIAEVFIAKYKGMRLGEAQNGVAYFQEQTANALRRLQESESRLKVFRTDNQLINYYEQTKYIADQKEDMETRETGLEMDLEAYRASLGRVEEKLDKRQLLQVAGTELLDIRNRLSAQYMASAMSEVLQKNTNRQADRTIETLKTDLRKQVGDLYSLQNTPEGVGGKKLLDEWLDIVLHTEETKSRLQVLRKRKAEFDKTFFRYAPLGSELNKLEREASTAEKEYLNLLHNLNQAILRARNLEVSDNIAITDPASLPLSPNPSKRMMLVIGGLVASLILVIALIVVREYFNDSIANPLRFKKLTGIGAVTAFARPDAHRNVHYTALDRMSYEKWRPAFVAAAQGSGAPPYFLAVPFLAPAGDVAPQVRNMAAYLRNKGGEWTSGMAPDTLPDQPAILLADRQEPEFIDARLLQSAAGVFLFVDASGRLDEYLMEQLRNWEAKGVPLCAVLLNTPLHHLEKYLGEIPKQRSRLRRIVKLLFKKLTR